ncbi:MAG: lysoplasmalogenase, partial [Treponema sp.]|nr:lysoplasmalogenase [Treponema sp.]
MEKILWIIFAAVSVLHLVSILLNRRRLQSISKACLIPVLIVIYSTAAGDFQAAALLALIFGWGGDTLLLNGKHLRFFLLGLSSFLAGHLCYAATMLIQAGRIEGLVLALSALAAFPLVYLVYRIIKPSKVMKIPVLIYETVILLMSIS